MKKKRTIQRTIHFPRRIFRVLLDVAPLYFDYDAEDPSRGSVSRALVDIIQRFSESENYAKKMRVRADIAKKFFNYIELQEKLMLDRKLKKDTKKCA